MAYQLTKQFEHDERALLVGTHRTDQSKWNSKDLMTELKRLAETAGAQPVSTIIQSISKPDPAYYIGKGKVNELADICSEQDVEIAIFNHNLSPAQQKNLEVSLKKKVLDRTGLILDIFAQRAHTKEGKLQVELAQLKYLLPRLTRMWTHLSRLGGGIGTRGPGETQLETDKRKINIRIHKIEKSLKDVSKHRLQHRRSRKGVPLPIIAMVGYTNSGKSTLFYKLTGQETLIEDKLFATLDPLIRKVMLPNRQKILLLDTVGFIRELPTQLVAAFKATLEEIQSADILLHIIDASHPMAYQHIETVNKIISELNVQHIPSLKVFNKIDLLENQNIPTQLTLKNDTINISALKEIALDRLLGKIQGKIQSFRKTVDVTVQYDNKEIMNYIHKYGKILSAEYEEKFLKAKVELDTSKADKVLQMLEEIELCKSE